MDPREELEQQLFGGLDSMEHKLVDQSIRVNKMHRQILEKSLNKTGVYRSQHQLLMYIYSHPNASQKDLAALYSVSTATVAVSLKKLERGGYIRRAVDKDDNRFNQICITEKGSAVVKQSMCVFRELEMAMFVGFTKEELGQFYEYLNRIQENMKLLKSHAESEGSKL